MATVAEARKANRPGWVYFAYAPEVNRCKIGWTSRTPEERLQFATDSPVAINVWGMLRASGETIEYALHCHFQRLRVRGEWFAVDEELRNFVELHTYSSVSDSATHNWGSDTWATWDRLQCDRQVQEILLLCQCNPAGLVRKYPDPLAYFYEQVKPQIVSRVGIHAHLRTDDFFKTSEAYDLVYEMCVDLLPR